jgi:hypothetical protein
MTHQRRNRVATPTITEHLHALSDAELVELALAKWGGPVEVFAESIVRVNPSTLNRWRRGEHRLNRRKREWFVTYLSPPPTKSERTP